jgi:hypothetical protein
MGLCQPYLLTMIGEHTAKVVELPPIHERARGRSTPDIGGSNRKDKDLGRNHQSRWRNESHGWEVASITTDVACEKREAAHRRVRADIEVR